MIHDICQIYLACYIKIKHTMLHYFKNISESKESMTFVYLVILRSKLKIRKKDLLKVRRGLER